MGCFGKIITKIIILIAIIAFFYFGGLKFVNQKINEYKNPPREEAIKDAEKFGNFENVESDYKIGRTIKAPKYSKMTIEHKPTGQKIAFVELPKGEKITKDDFCEEKINEKIKTFMDKNNIKGVEIDNLQILKKGTTVIKTNKIDYADFNVTIKKPVKKELTGFIGIYDINDEQGREKLVFSLKDKNKFSKTIVTKLLQTVDF